MSWAPRASEGSGDACRMIGDFRGKKLELSATLGSDTDLAILACSLIAKPRGFSKTVEIALTSLLPAVERRERLLQAIHAKPV